MKVLQREPITVEYDRITMKWAQNWHHFGLGRRIVLTLMDGDRAHMAQMIASGQAVVLMPQQRSRARRQGPFEKAFG